MTDEEHRGAYVAFGLVAGGLVVGLLFTGVTIAAVRGGPSPAVAFGAIVAAFSAASTASGFALPRWFWKGAAAYALVVVGGEVVREVDDASVEWVMWVIAGATVALSLVTLGAAVRSARRSKELERLLFAESAALAFFVTVLGVFTYGLLRAWVELPAISELAVASYGTSGWAAIAILIGRRYV